MYVMLYTLGRGWIEYLRVDQATHIFGLRLNDWTALLVFLAALAYFVVVTRQERRGELGAGGTDGDGEPPESGSPEPSHDPDMSSASRDEPAL
jgi:prolipoprotein diacylglyceryltransferase